VRHVQCSYTHLRYQTIDVKPVANGIAITHRKKSTSSHLIRSAHASTVIGNRTGPRRALGIAAQPAKRGYRPDLRKVSVTVRLTLPYPTCCKKSAFSLEPTGDVRTS
jgi:hypothetical protein